MPTTAFSPNEPAPGVRATADSARGSDRVQESPAGMARGVQRRLLILSNGHGEDEIGVSLVEEIRRQAHESVSIAAWPMVGRGAAFEKSNVARIGTQNLLPSEGFGTLSLSAFSRDLQAGWLQLHLRQLRDARDFRGRFDFAIAVGDIVPLLAATMGRLPFALVGCAKSVYYGPRYGYGAMERWLLRRAHAVCYARDERTAGALLQAGVAARYLGNPMMDRVTVRGVPLPRPPGTNVVACLPGSRSDREANAAGILHLIAEARDVYEHVGPTHFVFALPRDFDRLAMWRTLRPPSAGALGWEQTTTAAGTDEAVSHARCGQLHALFVQDALGDVLAVARVAIALAGTANEQAVGLGVPVVTFATSGVQGDYYLRMKMPFFGESAIQVEPRARDLADAVTRIVKDDVVHARMASAGRERMGRPGASAAIVADVLGHMRAPATP
ncbi:MAG: hypothetical protein H7066_20835 [Cytophagaceae bacterium]|nr:hypothetical protein [Gemmatimonadaceae bacterium]